MSAVMPPQHSPSNFQAEAAAKTAAAKLSITTAAFLIVLKTVTGVLTGSMSIWASLLDSVMDILASAVNFIAVRAAAVPADEDHAYGHGKVESLAGLFQALLITISGGALIWRAVLRILRPEVLREEWLGVASMAISIVVSLLLVRRLRRVADETDSLALRADSAHYASDMFTNAGALVALAIVGLTGFTLLDPLMSIAISLYIIYTAYGVASDAIDVLMDRRLPADVDATVASIIARYRSEGVIGFHELRTRRAGSFKFIDLHLEVERSMTLERAHDLTERVLADIEAAVPRSKVHVHTDPV